MKVLIVKTSALGDVVHALPVLPLIKTADPEGSVDWLIEEQFAELLDGHPLLRRVHRLQTKKWRSGGAGTLLREGSDLIRRLRQERFDIVLDLQGNSKSGLWTLLSGAPLRFGFDRRGVREWPNLLTTNRHISLEENDFHITDRSLAVARRAFPQGIVEFPAGPLPVLPEALIAVNRTLERTGMMGRKRVVLHYGTTWKTKLWPLDSWRHLARRMCDEFGLVPLLTWGNEEEHAATRSILEATANRAIVWPRGTLPDLAALLSRADLVIGGDTGPIHIAAAVGTSTISLFRATDANRNAPRGKKHHFLQAPMDCSPCLLKKCPKDGECGESISVRLVLDRISQSLELSE